MRTSAPSVAFPMLLSHPGDRPLAGLASIRPGGSDGCLFLILRVRSAHSYTMTCILPTGRQFLHPNTAQPNKPRTVPVARSGVYLHVGRQIVA